MIPIPSYLNFMLLNLNNLAFVLKPVKNSCKSLVRIISDSINLAAKIALNCRLLSELYQVVIDKHEHPR